MKKIITIIFLFGLIIMFAQTNLAFAQGMMAKNNTIVQNNDGHTAREEAEGKIIWEKLQSKELNCKDLSDDDFGVLGEYFMGQMMGDSHEAMNNMMIQMMGEEGEEQMHVAMGKRMSSCEPDAPTPQNMMMGGGMMGNFTTNPMSWFGWGFGGIFMILFWGFVVVGIVALIKWLTNQGQANKRNKTALNILEEKYAKGEIDKKEFNEKKKNLI